jgi:uncharacterized protein (DUF779 family)
MSSPRGADRGTVLPRLRATPAAVQALRRVWRSHGEVLLILSAGCCGGSAPMCFPRGEFRLGAHDVLVGEVEGCPVYVEQRQLDAWPHAEILLDVEEGAAEGLSLPAGDGLHFVCWMSSAAIPDRDRPAGQSPA